LHITLLILYKYIFGPLENSDYVLGGVIMNVY